MDTQFVLAKVTSNDIVFVGEEDSHQTRCLGDAKVFNEEEKEDYSFIPMDLAKKLIKHRMLLDT